MDEHLRHQRDTSLAQIEALVRRGRQIKQTPAVEAIRVWQQDCAAAINQLSGGSKAHWLARAYSGAFLVRAPSGGVVVEADAAEIVDRILGVLAQGAASLSQEDAVTAASTGAAPRPRRFEFVHNVELRAVLEQTFTDSHEAFDRGQFPLALILACSVIEAVLTDSLQHARPQADTAPDRPMADWTFEKRVAEAERAGLIRGGCARLPPVAWSYRDLTDAEGELRGDARVSEREAQLASQVLHVVMRDLDPGR